MFNSISQLPALSGARRFTRMARSNAAVNALADPDDAPEEASSLIPALQRIADDTNINLRRQGIGLQYEIMQRKGMIFVAIFRRETREVIRLVPYTPPMRQVRRFTQIAGMILDRYA